MADQPGFDAAEFHCYRCGDIITATSTDPEAFGRLVAEHRVTCHQGQPNAVQGA